MSAPVTLADPSEIEPAGAPSMALLMGKSHPLRAALSAEMHLRKFPDVQLPARILQVVYLIGPNEVSESIDAVQAFFGNGSSAGGHNARHISATIGRTQFSWERHNEFCTYMFILPFEGEKLFSLQPFEGISAWLTRLPGQIIRSSHIVLASSAEVAEVDIPRQFSSDDLVVTDLFDGKARVWTDFRLHPDGFGRQLVLDLGLCGNEPKHLVQRLQEMGNYRKMALLGLPVAQQYFEQLTNLERELAALVQEISDQTHDAETALHRLSKLSADLANIVAQTCFRMSATKAYAELCLDRMRGMAMRPVRGFASLNDFTERRLLPAMRTCGAFSSRLEDISERASATSALLRTRVDTGLAQRNQELLASINHRTELQLHLQRTVESLSVIAITYYALGVWEKAKPGLAAISGFGGGPLFDLLLVPAVLLAAYFLMRRLTRSAHHKALCKSDARSPPPPATSPEISPH